MDKFKPHQKFERIKLDDAFYHPLSHGAEAKAMFERRHIILDRVIRRTGTKQIEGG